MAIISIVPPFETYPDVDGDPLEDGYIYVGVTGLNPLTNPIAVFSDVALTIPVAQPIRTIGGHPVVSGTPIRMYAAADDYSILIRNKNSTLVYSSLSNQPKFGDLNSTLVKYDRTAAEISAGVIPTNYYYQPDPVIDPRRYGADPTGVVDATIALRNACLVLQAAVGGTIDFADGTYKVYTDTGDTAPIGVFTSITGLELRAAGAKLVVNRAFSSAVIITIFSFTAVHDINLGDFVGTNPTGARSEIYNRGAHMFYFYQGCSNVRAGNLDVTDFSGGYNFYRLHADPASYRCRNIRIANIKGLRTGYPLVTTESGDELEAQINTDSCGRSYFNYASRQHKIVVVSKNQDASANCLLYAADGERLSDIDLEFTDTDSTNAAPATRKSVYIAFRDETPNIIRNIKVKLNVDKGAGYLSNGLSFDKLTAAGAPDPTDRGHIVQNLEISGYIDTNSAPIQLGDYTTWGPGEFVDNIYLHDIYMKTAQSALYFFSSLKSQAVLENVVHEAALNIVGNTTGKVICIGVKAPDTTIATVDTSIIHYYSCNITSGSTQSYINKMFFGSPGSGSFTGTLTGCTTSPTGTFYWSRSGTQVTITLDAGLSAVSNTNACTITGMPALIRPVRDQHLPARVLDNSVNVLGTAFIASTGVITLYTGGFAGLTAFTAANNKGLQPCSFTYGLG